MLSIFSYVSGPSVCLPWRSVCSSPLPIFKIVLFLFLELSHVSSLYILEIKPLSEVSLANIFSYTVGSLFLLLMFSLAMQKLFNWMRSHLFILSFMPLALGDILVKILLCGISEIFLPMFSCRTFITWFFLDKVSCFLFLIFIVIQLQLCAFSPHPSTPPHPNPPPSPTSTLPLDFVHVSFIVGEHVF